MAFNADLENYRNGEAVILFYVGPDKATGLYRGLVCENRIANDGCRILTLRKTVEVDGQFVEQFNSFRADRIATVRSVS